MRSLTSTVFCVPLSPLAQRPTGDALHSSCPPPSSAGALGSEVELAAAGSGNVQQKFDWAQLHSLGDVYDAAVGAEGRKGEADADSRGQEEDDGGDAGWAARVDGVIGLFEEEEEAVDESQRRSAARQRGGGSQLQRQQQMRSMPVPLTLPSTSSPTASGRLPLVVVASLLSSAANLAGVARSAEVFGVAGLCLSSSSLLCDPLFVRISVSSQRWLPLMELPAERVKAQLLDWKAQGWTVVALEQTRESVQLPDYTWPSRIVLLLGNEREGIPMELLHLVDAAVEIPQRGVIRSLNVHVATAVALYDFASKRGGTAAAAAAGQNSGRDSSAHSG